jgi:hypothetical protein
MTVPLPRYKKAREENEPSAPSEYIEPRERYAIGFHRTLDVGEALSGEPHAADLPYYRTPPRSIFYALEQYEGRGEVLM